MPDNLKEKIAFVKNLAIEAGASIMEVYALSDFNVESKEDQSPLTLADRRANKVICDSLKNNYKDIPIISEEDHIPSFDIRKKYNLCWLVDPLDGTKEFVKRNDEFTVNIALSYNGKIILGVVYAPVFKDLYWAYQNGGAFKSTNGSTPLSIKANSYSSSDPQLRIVCSRSHLSQINQDYIDQYSSPILIPKGSSLKMMHIAEGKADLYPRLGPTMEWDTAASQIIVEEAGGQINQFDNGQTLIYNKENLLNPYFIAIGDQK